MRHFETYADAVKRLQNLNEPMEFTVDTHPGVHILKPNGDLIIPVCSEVEHSASPAGYTPDFARGIVYALARLVELYDQPSMARCVLQEANLSRQDLEQCSEYDLSFLRNENPELPKGV